MKKTATELQEIGDKVIRLVSMRVAKVIKATNESLHEELTEQDLDLLLQDLEQDLASNGIHAIFYPL